MKKFQNWILAFNTSTAGSSRLLVPKATAACVFSASRRVVLTGQCGPTHDGKPVVVQGLRGSAVLLQ